MTELKTDSLKGFLNDVSCVPLQQALRQADRAYQNFYRGCKTGENIGYPKFRKKNGRQSAAFTKSARFRLFHVKGCKWAYLTLPKVGRIKFRWTRDLPSAPSSVTIIKEPCGQYYVSFPVETEPKPAPKPLHDSCGIDQGVTNRLVVRADDGTGYTMQMPDTLGKYQKKVRKLQRKLSRQKKGSNNYRKTQRKLARVWKKIRDTRLDTLTKTAKRLTDENQAVTLETLNVQGMTRKPAPKPDPDHPGHYLPNKRKAKAGLNRGILNAGFGMFDRLVTRMGEEKNRAIIHISRWEPTSQTCCVCHHRDGRKALSIREWECPNCHTMLDRDANAAVNIMLAAGLGERLNDCEGNKRALLAQASVPATPKNHA